MNHAINFGEEMSKGLRMKRVAFLPVYLSLLLLHAVQNGRGIVWEERDTLDVHAGECPFAVRKGSPEELG
jgi:hypothetical protein